MESQSRIRPSFLYYYLAVFFLLAAGCATTQLENRVAKIEGQLEQLQDEALMVAAAEVGAATRLYGRNNLIGGTKSVDNVGCAALSDFDLVLVIDGSGEIWFYWYDDDGDDTTPGAENSPYIIEPDDVDTNCAGLGRWRLTYSINFNSSSGGPGFHTFLEDGDYGFNYYRIQAPSQITTDQVFELGRWRTDVSNNDPSADVNVEVDETNTIFNIGCSGISANRQFVLPPATGSGVEFIFTLNDDCAGIYDIQVEPDGTDWIIGTSATGDYMGADGVGDSIHLKDCGSGQWCIVGTFGSWTEQ